MCKSENLFHGDVRLDEEYCCKVFGLTKVRGNTILQDYLKLDLIFSIILYLSAPYERELLKIIGKLRHFSTKEKQVKIPFSHILSQKGEKKKRFQID